MCVRIIYIYVCLHIGVYVLGGVCVCVCDPASGVRAIHRREGFHSLQKDLPKASLKCSALQGLQERVWIRKLSCSDATFKHVVGFCFKFQFIQHFPSCSHMLGAVFGTVGEER